MIIRYLKEASCDAEMTGIMGHASRPRGTVNVIRRAWLSKRLGRSAFVEIKGADSMAGERTVQRRSAQVDAGRL
jgi:hypothetical protein